MRAAMLIGRPSILRIAIVSLLVVALNFAALAAIQGVSAFAYTGLANADAAIADSGGANADTGAQTTCDLHHNPDCSDNQLSVGEINRQDDVIDGVYPWEPQVTTNWQCDAGLFGFCLPF